MGTCSSAQKKTDSTAKASNGMCFKAKDPSPIKEKPLNEEKPVNLLGVMSPDFGRISSLNLLLFVFLIFWCSKFLTSFWFGERVFFFGSLTSWLVICSKW